MERSTNLADLRQLTDLGRFLPINWEKLPETREIYIDDHSPRLVIKKDEYAMVNVFQVVLEGKVGPDRYGMICRFMVTRFKDGLDDDLRLEFGTMTPDGMPAMVSYLKTGNQPGSSVVRMEGAEEQGYYDSTDWYNGVLPARIDFWGTRKIFFESLARGKFEKPEILSLPSEGQMTETLNVITP